MIKTHYLTVAMFAMSMCMTAQERAEVVFYAPAVDSLCTINQQNNYNQISLDGYRIQVYSGSGSTSKTEALAARDKMYTLFPKLKTYAKYNAPIWRVRVGDFRYRSEAMSVLSAMRGAFPSCYIVPDNAVLKKTFQK